MKKSASFSVLVFTLGLAAFVAVKLCLAQQTDVTPDLANGEQKFSQNCFVCHGSKGHGDGPFAAQLVISPDDIYEELINPFGFKVELVGSVLEGDNGEGGLMPAFKHRLSEQDVYDIFAYIENLNHVDT